MRKLRKLTNAELYKKYQEVTSYTELDELMNEALNRFAWYVDQDKLPLGDTALNTYETWEDFPENEADPGYMEIPRG